MSDIYKVTIILPGEDGEEDVEIHSRKHARKLAEAFGCMKAYRRRRLEIRHAEKARRVAQVAKAQEAAPPIHERHLRHPEAGKREKR